MYVLIVSDFLFVISTVFGLLQLINIAAWFIPYKSERKEKAENVKCIIVTIGDDRVTNSLKEVVTQLEELHLDYIIVSSNPRIPFRNVITVPGEEDGNKFKAIRYFVKNYARNDYWYVFLDDDSYPFDDGFLYDIAYFSKKDPMYAMGNGILMPRKSRSKITFALDWIRYFDALTRYKFNALIRKPVYGVQGELLIARSDVLMEIWPEIEESITEDFNFAMYAMKKGYKFFQSKTIVSIKSPNSLGDFIKQRKRWANVIFDSIRHRNLLQLFYTFSGVVLSPLFAPLWLFYYSIPGFLAGLYYWSVYIYGGAKARSWFLPIMPIISAIEILGCLYGILRRDREFIIIDKT